MKPMRTAPRDRLIEIKVDGQWFTVWFLDCAWLRERPGGNPEVTDCWRVDDGETDSDTTIDFELDEPQGWREYQREAV